MKDAAAAEPLAHPTECPERTPRLVPRDTCMIGMTPTVEVDPKPIASMGRADRPAMSFGQGWSLKNHENNKPW